MRTKKILLIEDEEEQRIGLAEIFRMLGFEVVSPNNLEEAYRLTSQYWDEIDVGLIDMDLSEWQTAVVGAEIAIEVRKAKKAENNFSCPEFIILSAHQNVPYYTYAMELGVAEYLPKNPRRGAGYQKRGERSVDPVLRYIRVLALRHALQSETLNISAAVSRLAAISQNPAEAVIRFCQEVLAPELKSCLTAPFFIIFSEDGDTQICCQPDYLPAEYTEFYKTLQALAHIEGKPAYPFVLNSEKLKSSDLLQVEATDEMYEKLNGTAFLPLTLNPKLRLSIGIIQEKVSDRAPFVEDSEVLCSVMAQHLKPTLIEVFVTVLSQWHKLRTLMHNTSQLCLLFGQEQKKILRQIKNAEELPEVLPQLMTLAKDLYSTGETLTYIMDSDSHLVPESYEHAAEFIWQRWSDVAGKEGRVRFEVEGNCQLRVEHDDFYLIVTRLLQWLLKRRNETPSSTEPHISVNCSETSDWNEIVFEDRSFRLSSRLRNELFLPFSQAVSLPFENHSEAFEDRINNSGLYLPLFLVKMLVEGRYGGWVEDYSDKIEGEYGNRILVRFPKSKPTALKPDSEVLLNGSAAAGAG